MPIRFQVDPDFYDHPKTIQLSDAAVALWTRAGSYAAGKTTDGYIADVAMTRLSSDPKPAAAELVKARLWRRVRGGYQFHQWELRNLTRDHIEAQRKADRDRKAKRVHGLSSDESPQVRGGEFRPESGGIPDRIPDGSVSVSVSVSESLKAVPNVSSASDNYVAPALAEEPRGPVTTIGAAKLSKIYCDRVKLSDRGKVCMVVTNATAAGFTDDQIGAALGRLASDSRPVTPDTLRIEIEGKKAPGGVVTGTDGIVRAASGRPIRGKGWEES